MARGGTQSDADDTWAQTVMDGFNFFYCGSHVRYQTVGVASCARWDILTELRYEQKADTNEQNDKLLYYQPSSEARDSVTGEVLVQVYPLNGHSTFFCSLSRTE